MAGVGPRLGLLRLGRSGSGDLSGGGLLDDGHPGGGHGLRDALHRLRALRPRDGLEPRYALCSRYDDRVPEGSGLRGHLLSATGCALRRDGSLDGTGLSDDGLTRGVQRVRGGSDRALRRDSLKGLPGDWLSCDWLSCDGLSGDRLPRKGLSGKGLSGDRLSRAASWDPLRNGGLRGRDPRRDGLTGSRPDGRGGNRLRAARDPLGGNGLPGRHGYALRRDRLAGPSLRGDALSTGALDRRLLPGRHSTGALALLGGGLPYRTASARRRGNRVRLRRGVVVARVVERGVMAAVVGAVGGGTRHRPRGGHLTTGGYLTGTGLLPRVGPLPRARPGDGHRP